MSSENDQGCTCQGCSRLYTVDLIIPNELWEKIKPMGKAKGAGLLCPTCILERVADMEGYVKFDMVKPENRHGKIKPKTTEK